MKRKIFVSYSFKKASMEIGQVDFGHTTAVVDKMNEKVIVDLESIIRHTLDAYKVSILFWKELDE